VKVGPGKVEVRAIPYGAFRDPQGKPIEHGIILKVVATNICGSDQRMVRGRTTAPSGVLGHEITGEIIEKGRDVEYLEIGDLVSIPFNLACGRCRVRMDGAWIGSIDISINKAFTARAFDISTADLAKESQPGKQFYGIQIMGGS